MKKTQSALTNQKKETKVPTFKMSRQTEKETEEAIQEYQSDRALKLKS